MQKVALVTRSSLAEWRSCRTITANLLGSYLAAPHLDRQVFRLPEGETNYDIWQLAQKISSWQPDQIVFIDHQPCPGGLIQALARVWNQGPLPRLLVHIFGDFVLQCAEWLQSEPALKQFSILWICASTRQKRLVEQMLVDPRGTVTVVPFPVDVSHFRYAAEVRERGRKHFGLAGDAFVFFYSGRLSSQKNVIQLIQAFQGLRQLTERKLVLALAGPVDDLGSPYFGKIHPEGLMSYRLQDVIRSSLVDSVEYWGNLAAEELLLAYTAADLFVSLSTHNDEDYGMAPAEAFATGCPGVLTDWGGYSDFHDLLPESCSLIPTDFAAPEIFNLNRVRKALFAGFLNASTSRRQDKSAQAAAVLSCEAVAQKLTELLSHPERVVFQGWNENFKKVVYSFNVKPWAPFSGKEGPSDLYRKLYSVYATGEYDAN